MTTIVLDLLSFRAIIAAVLLITAQSPVVAVIYLIGVFLIRACYLVCLGVPFIGLSYLIVYVGAVAVLFLFVVMMLNVRLSEIVSVGHEYTKSLPLGAIVGVLFLFTCLSLMPAIETHRGEMALTFLNSVNNTILGVSGNNVRVSNVHLAFTQERRDAVYLNISQRRSLGLSLYTYGSLWLLLISIVLLLSMIGPIALCLRSRNA